MRNNTLSKNTAPEPVAAYPGVTGESVKPQHTPGEWYIVTHNGRMTVKGPGAASLADMYHPPSGDALANARLMAAAPKLLRALQDLVGVYDDEFGIVAPEMNAALDVLACATGATQ